MNERAGRRLLIVDDEAMVLGMLTDVLETFGYVVDAVDCGEAALERFRANHYAVVITDLLMPGLSGLDVAERLRRLDARIPIILLTAGASDLQDARLSSVFVVHKPVSLDALKSAVETVAA